MRESESGFMLSPDALIHFPRNQIAELTKAVENRPAVERPAVEPKADRVTALAPPLCSGILMPEVA